MSIVPDLNTEPASGAPATRPPEAQMAWIPGGTFLMGSDHHYPEEAPAHRVSVSPFWMDRHAVSNAEFARFVEATGHVTLAERPASSLSCGPARHLR